MGAELHQLIVHGEVHHATPELEEPLARVAVAPVLLHGVIYRLLRQAVLQLERGDRESVDEEREVERKLRLVPAVPQLARDTEPVGGVPLLRPQAAASKPPLGFRAMRFLNRWHFISNERMEQERRKRGSADYLAARGVMREVLVKAVNELRRRFETEAPKTPPAPAPSEIYLREIRDALVKK